MSGFEARTNYCNTVCINQRPTQQILATLQQLCSSQRWDMSWWTRVARFLVERTIRVQPGIERVQPCTR